jgi:hypothetical protein
MHEVGNRVDFEFGIDFGVKDEISMSEVDKTHNRQYDCGIESDAIKS